MLLGLALAVALVSVGSASTVNGTLNVSANVTAGACTVNNPTLSFGPLSFPLLNGVTSVGTITVTCASGVQYAIDLSNGTRTTDGGRALVGPDGASFITYNLYTEPAYSQVWGTGLGGVRVAGVGTGLAQPVPVYGLIPIQPAPPVQGQYLDTVVITVAF
jgi:spore coat protein U-like protein